MKQIPLTQGKFALVDDEDYPYLIAWKWRLKTDKKRKAVYAVRGDCGLGAKNTITISMHRSVALVTNPKIQVDHKDGDGLNNQKSNLREATRSQNGCNKPAQRTNKSGYKGVSLKKRDNKWLAQICINGKKMRIGVYADIKDAALAYNAKAQELHGEFAYLNKM